MECLGSLLSWLPTNHDEVTMERENCTKVRQTTASMKTTSSPRHYCSFASVSKQQQTTPKCNERLFHGGNTGSNPVGDANNPKVLTVASIFEDTFW
jgi:hypothetical protein